MSIVESNAVPETEESVTPTFFTLSQNQRLIWLGQQLAPGVPLYEMVHLFTLHGVVQEETFREAFRRLVDETEVLRLVSPGSAGSSEALHVQRLCVADCEFVNLADQQDIDQTLQRFVSERMAERLELTSALYDSVLLQLSADKYCWYLKLHHLLTDGLNGKAVLAGLEEQYLALQDGGVAAVPKSYAEYVEYEAAMRHRPEYPEHRKWWEERSVEYTGSRFYRGGVSSESALHDRVVIDLSTELSDAIRNTAMSSPFRQLTPSLSCFNVFVTALFAWLHRLEGHRELGIGATSHGRITPQFRNTIGLFMQLLPFRVQVADDETFESLSRKLATEASGFFRHAVPGVTRPETQKAFDVALNFVDLSVGQFAGLPTTMDWVHNNHGDPRRRLTLSIQETTNERRFQLLFDFNRAAFDDTEQSRVMAQFSSVLHQITDCPSTTLNEFAFLTDAEQEFLKQHSGSRTEQSSQNVWARFNRVAEANADTIAVHDNSGEKSYRQLREQGWKLGEQINAAQCGPIVPLLCRRDSRAVVGMVGILASGRCFLPIDLDLPQVRIQELLKDSGAGYAIDARQEPVLAALNDVTETDDSLAQEACYILYTSGSTGRPNGVVVGHDAICNLLDEFERLAPLEISRTTADQSVGILSERQRRDTLSGGHAASGQVNYSWWTNVGFDVAIYEVFSALLFGRSLYIPDERTRNAADLLFEWLCKHHIESAYLPPFLLTEFTGFLADQPDCTLKRLLVGVEPIPQCLLASISSHLPELQLINGYGPTEATVCATLMPIDRHDSSETPVAIGRPVSGNVCRIVDRHDNSVPPGVPGELLIGGAGLARGYHSRPALTTARFVTCSKHPACRTWYRTGDRVRQRADGCLEFLGRIDDQVKINGHRVEPNEVAHHIRNFSDITDCVVVSRTDERSTHLAAFIVSFAPIDVASLKSWLASRLPRHLVPARIISVESFPRTTNGKVDVATLLERHNHELTRRHTENVSPRTPLEFTLVAIWREILHTTDFGIEATFFEFGGDSLDAMKFVARAETVGVHISPSDVFANPTVSELAAAISQRSFSDKAPSLNGDTAADSHATANTSPSGETQPLTLSTGQKRLWYLAQKYPDSAAYHLQIRFQVTGPLDESLVIDSFRTIVGRHEALRTNVVIVSGEPHPVLRTTDLLEAFVADVPSQTVDEQETHVNDACREQGTRAFDLANGPLLRIAVFRLSPIQFRMALTVHHIAIDQNSLAVVLKEFEHLYAAKSHGQDASLPVPLQFSAAMRTQALKSQKAAGHLKYWEDQLQDCATALPLPFDHDPHGARSLAGDTVDVLLSNATAAGLRSLALRRNVSLNVLLLTAFNTLLHRYTGQSDLMVGVPVSNRRTKDMEQTVGFFVESVPVRSQCDTAAGFEQFLQHTNRTFAAALDHADVPFDDIVKRVNPSRGNASNPLFQSMFVMQEPLPPLRPTDDICIEPEITPLETSKLDLTLFAAYASGTLRCCIEYSTDLFLRETIERFRDHWVLLLESIVKDPGLSVARLNLLTAQERRQLTHEMQNDESVVATAECIHELIERQAIQFPDAVAVSCEQRSLSYAELNSQADQLARRLRDQSVVAGDCVALRVERSPEMLVAILGILKSGAAYVPLDSAQPRQRLQQILTDCGATAVVVQSRNIEAFTDFDGAIICPDEVPLSAEQGVFDTATDAKSTADGLAYIMYTSGSTGQPKGVEVTHRNLVLSTTARFDYYDDTPQRFLLLSSCAFDSSVAGIFWTLCSGGTLVLPAPNQEHDVVALADLIADQQVTHSLCLPSLYELLLDHAQPGKLTSLQTMIVAGETCLPRLVSRHFAKLPDTTLYNEYGPTEATVWSTVHRIETGDRNVVPIGQPVPGTTIWLLDDNLQPVPTGLPGEVYVAGRKLARGYRNRPDLTAKAFVKNPFSHDPSSRLYRTGDLAKRRPDGAFVFLGRADSQLKINGHRVEAEEIEAAIVSHPGVREVVVGTARVESRASVSADVDSLVNALANLPKEEAEFLLRDAESQPASVDDGSDQQSFTATHTDNDVTIMFRLSSEDSIATPRSSQRKWLLDQALRDVSSDLQYLKTLAPRFVPGSDERHIPRDISAAKLTEQEIMEDWQYPLMQAMAGYATESHGDLLEIGFGRGVSATLIQSFGVRSHTIIEANPHSIAEHYEPWRKQYPERTIQMIQGRWQDVPGQPGSYDSIFFHAFPLNEAEFVEYIANSVTFAEHFFPTAAKLLRNGGVFTYLTTEIDSLSRRHQRSLFQHFREVRMQVQPLSVPQDTKDAWWADSMIVLQATL